MKNILENICVPNVAANEYPELIEYQSENSKRKHYALLLKPFGAIRGLQYPVIQLVYGGPGVQLVRNAWSTLVLLLFRCSFLKASFHNIKFMKF